MVINIDHSIPNLLEPFQHADKVLRSAASCVDAADESLEVWELGESTDEGFAEGFVGHEGIDGVQA